MNPIDAKQIIKAAKYGDTAAIRQLIAQDNAIHDARSVARLLRAHGAQD